MTATVSEYALTGESKRRAHESGLVNAEWFLADVDPARMREFQVRTNARAALDIGLWAFMLAALVWGVLNWVPVLPLDGGHMTQSLLEIRRALHANSLQGRGGQSLRRRRQGPRRRVIARFVSSSSLTKKTWKPILLIRI